MKFIFFLISIIIVEPLIYSQAVHSESCGIVNFMIDTDGNCIDLSHIGGDVAVEENQLENSSNINNEEDKNNYSQTTSTINQPRLVTSEPPSPSGIDGYSTPATISQPRPDTNGLRDSSGRDSCSYAPTTTTVNRPLSQINKLPSPLVEDGHPTSTTINQPRPETNERNSQRNGYFTCGVTGGGTY